MAGELLNVTAGEAEGARISLNGELVIGRSVAELPGLVTDTEISRVHARVWRTPDDSLMIEDLGSRNGTFVNGARIEGPAPLEPGDQVRTGRTTMELVEGDAAAVPTYDALVEPEPEPEPDQGEARAQRSRFARPAIVLAALLAGGGIGALVAHERRGATKTEALVITHRVQTPAPRPRLVPPPRPVVLPPQTATGTDPGRAVFVRAFCSRGATASHGLCACAYDELTRREPYAELVTQLASARGRIPAAVESAARACGAA